MPSLFRKNSKPASNKNFFQNYGDHLKYLVAETATVVEQYNKIETEEQFVRFVANNLLNKFNIFEPLRDAHDYVDEIGGVIVAPLVMTIAAIAALTNAVWEGVHGLAIEIGLAQIDEFDDHGANAMHSLCAAGLLYGYAIALFLKSAISLVTRPGVTVLQGFAAQNKERFYNDDSVAAVISSKLAELDSNLDFVFSTDF